MAFHFGSQKSNLEWVKRSIIEIKKNNNHKQCKYLGTIHKGRHHKLGNFLTPSPLMSPFLGTTCPLTLVTSCMNDPIYTDRYMVNTP